MRMECTAYKRVVIVLPIPLKSPYDSEQGTGTIYLTFTTPPI